LKALVQQLGLQQDVFIYPGADEVGLTMLSKYSVDLKNFSANVQLIFRDPETVNFFLEDNN
jgi:hypothetical protein